MATGPAAVLTLSPISPAAGHFQPVQILLQFMKRVVADFVVGAHRENRVARGAEGVSMYPCMAGVRGVTGLGIPIFGSKMCPELLPHRFGNRRFVIFEAGEPGL